MSSSRIFRVSAAISGAICAAVVSQSAIADGGGNPFAMTPLSDGYKVVAEGKCGEGKCGGSMKGAKGREGKCGMMRMDVDGDGNVTRAEFMQGHAAVFDRIDTNGDGVLDADERSAHMKMMRQKMGKCGEGKCGQDKEQQ